MKDLKEIFDGRRSISFFDTAKKIDDKVLADIFDLAVSGTPSAWNLQPWGVIALKSEDAKKRLYPLSFDQQKVLDAAAIFVITGNRTGYDGTDPVWDEYVPYQGKEKVENMKLWAYDLFGSTPDRQTKFAESHAALLCMSIMYAARYYGVETHPISGLKFDEVKKEFDIPENHEVVMCIALGYFDEKQTLWNKLSRRGYKETVREI